VPKTSVRVDGAFAVIDLELSVRWPCSIPDVTQTVRNRVRHRVEELIERSAARGRTVRLGAVAASSVIGFALPAAFTPSASFWQLHHFVGHHQSARPSAPSES
jgi:peroxiredoxin